MSTSRTPETATTDPAPADTAHSDPARTAAPSTDPAHLLEAARIAAGAAADHLRSIDRTRIEREDKTSGHDIVTIHDRACEEIIVENLRRLVPGCRILGEEGGERAGDAAAEAGQVTFYVDPIDGTSNFAAGLPLFCVSIGAAVDGVLVAGVVDAPILGQVFTAGPDGARLNRERLRPRPTRAARDALVLTGFPTSRDLDEDAPGSLACLQEIVGGVSAVRHLGSAALELSYVAAGWADATMLAGINSWDVAAGFLLVEQAGGSLGTWPGDGPVDAPAHERPAYVACTGPERLAVLDDVQDRIQAARDARAGRTSV